MHEAMSIQSGAEWNPDRTTSHIEEALVRLDEAVAQAEKTAHVLIERLDIVLQPEAPSEAKEGGEVLSALPSSLLVRRVDEAARNVERIAQRIKRAMDRLDT